VIDALGLIAGAPPPGAIPIGGGRSLHRRIAARLSLVEYASLLYRALIPVPVWFAFFQNQDEYGHLFSSVTTVGLCMLNQVDP
jgi:hypothetical protein